MTKKVTLNSFIELRQIFNAVMYPDEEESFLSVNTVPDISDLYDPINKRVQEALDFTGEVHSFVAHGSCKHRVAFIPDGTKSWLVYIYDIPPEYRGPFDSLTEAADAASCYALLLAHNCTKS